jgi:HEAT repeat protein
MDHALQYAKALAVLLEEVKAGAPDVLLRSGVLRARRFARTVGMTLMVRDSELRVNGVVTQRAATALQCITNAMLTHGVEAITLRAGVPPHEMLRLVALLARARAAASTGPSIFDELRERALWDVHVLAPVQDDACPVSHTHAADVALERADQIEARVGDITRECASAVASGDAVEVTRLVYALVRIEQDATAPEPHACWEQAFAQLATENVLRVIATHLPTLGELHDAAVLILQRAGDDGANLLLDELLRAESLDQRRVFFNALVTVRRGVPRLVALLTHADWYVVRNAACLLGEIGLRHTAPDLAAQLQHTDARVRVGVVTALLRLDMASARSAVRALIRDQSPDVRRLAVRAFLADDDGQNGVALLMGALDFERDVSVQVDILHALGTIGTSDAIQKLIRLSSVTAAAGRPAEFRIAVAEALATARTTASVPFLKTLLRDSDAHARAAAQHLLRAVS